jgi:hypothetical protein
VSSEKKIRVRQVNEKLPETDGIKPKKKIRVRQVNEKPLETDGIKPKKKFPRQAPQHGEVEFLLKDNLGVDQANLKRADPDPSKFEIRNYSHFTQQAHILL